MSTEFTLSSFRRQNVPIELITEILRWVETPYRDLERNQLIKRPNRHRNEPSPYLVARETLRHACLVSTTFYAVAKKLLYRNVLLLHATDIVLLFRTLLEDGGAESQPQHYDHGLRASIVNLACLVTLFDEVAIRDTAGAWRLLSYPPHAEPRDMTILYISRLDLGRVLDEEAGDFWSTPQRLLGALLGLTERLNSLVLQCPTTGLPNLTEYEPLDRVIRMLRRHQPGLAYAAGDGNGNTNANANSAVLSCLTTLAVQDEESSGGGIASDGQRHARRHNRIALAGLLTLPTLRTLLARTCIEPLVDELGGGVAGPGPGGSSSSGESGGLALERIVLHRSCSLEENIESYARLCARLRRLEIFAVPSDLPVVDAALLPVADRLEVLSLRLLGGNSNNADIGGGGGGGGPGLGGGGGGGAAPANALPANALPANSEGRVAWLRANFTRLVELTIEDRILFRDAVHMERVGLAARLPASLVSLVLIEHWGPPLLAAAATTGSVLRRGAGPPPGEEHLDTIARVLMRAASECPERLPSLRCFVFDRSPQRRLWRGTISDTAFRERGPGLREAFVVVGVEFSVRYTSPDDDRI